MSDLRMPFAKRISDGRCVSAEEVPRGLDCNCVCPECGHPVQARQGTERAWHFSHAKAGDCADAYEKSVHETAKQLLRERKRSVEKESSSVQVFIALRRSRLSSQPGQVQNLL